MIILVRHGETEWNVARRFQGRADSPLTERGRRQARAMAGLVRDLVAREDGPWRLVASPSIRTRLTAEAIAAATGLSLETDDRLMEIDCGEWEGLTWDEAPPIPDDNAERWTFRRPGGESCADVHVRVVSFLAALPPEPGRRLVVVSHGVTGRVLRGAYAGLEPDGVFAQETPQDAVFRLMEGQIDRFDCEPVD